jgi:hypothetical protein
MVVPNTFHLHPLPDIPILFITLRSHSIPCKKPITISKMVKIAIAGGAGNVAQEIIDVLVASKKHEILILTRRVSTSLPFLRMLKLCSGRPSFRDRLRYHVGQNRLRKCWRTSEDPARHTHSTLFRLHPPRSRGHRQHPEKTHRRIGASWREALRP